MITYEFEISDMKYLGNDVLELVLESKVNNLTYLPVPSYIYIYNDDLSFSRPYTPIKVNDSYVTFFIRLTENGIFSKYIQNKKIGDIVKLSRMIIHDDYATNKHKNVLMIVGHTALPTMLQILNKSHEESADNTKFTVIYCTKRENDEFSKEYVKKYDERIKFIHLKEKIMANGKTDWEESISLKDLKSLTFENEKKVVDYVYVCGPVDMLETVCGVKGHNCSQGELKGILKDLGFKEEEVFKF